MLVNGRDGFFGNDRLPSNASAYQTFMNEWLSIDDLIVLFLVAVPDTERYEKFFNLAPNIANHFLKNPNIATLKSVLRKRAEKSKFFRSQVNEKNTRELLLKLLTGSRTSLELRLLVLNFLTEKPMAFELSSNFRTKPLNLLFCILYASFPSSLEASVIAGRLLEDIKDIRSMTDFSKIIDPMILMLNAVIHKFDKEMARSLVHELLDCIESNSRANSNPYNFLSSNLLAQFAQSLLILLALDFVFKDIWGLAKWLGNFAWCQLNFKLPNAESVEQVDLKALEDFCATFLRYFGVETVEARNVWFKILSMLEDVQFQAILSHPDILMGVVSLRYDLNAIRSEMVKNKVVDFLNRADCAALTATTGLWSDLEDAHRDTAKAVLLSLLSEAHANPVPNFSLYLDLLKAAALLWDDLEDAHRDTAKAVLLSLLSEAHANPVPNFSLYLNLLKAAVLLWDDLDKVHHDRAKDLLSNMLYSPDYRVCCLYGVEALVSLWDKLDDVYLDAAKQRAKKIIYSRWAPASNSWFCADGINIVLFLWEHFENDMREWLVNCGIHWLSRGEDAVEQRNIEALICLYCSEVDKARLPAMIKQLTQLLSDNDADLRLVAFKCLAGIIIHHPEYDYSFDQLSRSLEKTWIINVVEMTKAVPELRVLRSHKRSASEFEKNAGGKVSMP